MPPSAPQKGTVNTLDTLDGRLTNAQQAIDPTNGKAYLYTQQAVAGGAGAEVRWYKINPKKLTAKTHFISDSKLYVFDGVVSTDRLVKGSTTAFGDSVIAGFSTSSPTDFQAVQMVSLIGSGTQSGLVLVKQSATFDDDFTCPPVCRWGDYAAATPDPSADPGAAHGAVWLASTWVHSQFQIGTWNWAANP